MTAGALVSPAGLFEQRLDALPAPIRSKFYELSDAAEALADRANSAFAAWQDAHRAAAEGRAAHAAAEDSDRRGLNSIHLRAKAQRDGRAYEPAPGSPLAMAAAELARREARAAQRLAERDRTQQASTALRTVVTAIRKVLETVEPTALQPIVIPASRTRTPRDAAADLERLRASIATVSGELRELERAPVSLAEAAARLDAFLDAAADAWEPPTLYFTARQPLPCSLDDMTPYRLLSMLAALSPVRAAFHERVARSYERLPASVSTADEPGLRAALVKRMQKLSVEEEQLVLEAGAAGLAIGRRAEADPVVVLTVVLDA